MEELLREAACLGNLDAVQKLLQNGACINSQHTMNGWTALHWACKRSHVAIVQHLLQSGADVNLLSCKAESAADITSDDHVLKLLQQQSKDLVPARDILEDNPAIVPNYIRHPPFPYYDIQKSLEKLPQVQTVYSASSPISHHSEAQALSPTLRSPGESLSREMGTLDILHPDRSVSTSLTFGSFQPPPLSSHASHSHFHTATSPAPPPSSSTQPSLLVKVRVCGSGESDFVEVEVGPVTYPSLIAACCEELEVASTDVVKIRKLPNILIRKDRDVQRMKVGQELEVVLKSKATPTSATTSPLSLPFDLS